ncbi:Gram-negative bacterial tonB protein [Terriglobus roseus DSM 18391]|uniref:Gram-negative bacterial tonB protein n=1 Tax=Terriglobus roseus (strain DSM 18391 / NRRL B-41598 / KBS 63) TaxID=926566 RepID=I3ZIB4_TERRK|nr:energy transducer TonB [Terriglobus roseus]AFL88982.1 Gram-negative bacterial tonB protein [Terriglobus roseus DSM 18391]
MPRVTDTQRPAVPGTAAWMRSSGRQWTITSFPKTLSALLHLGAVFVLVNAWWLSAPRLKPAGTSTGQHVMVTYNPGKPAPPVPHRVTTHSQYPKTTPTPAMPQDANAAPTVQGNDALGSGTVSLLYVQAFPGQKPDLSGAGVTGDVIVDVEIDDTGHVAQVHARRGMGAQIDDLVVATVERWVFHQALRNGIAVRSERELRFHFDRRRDADCGWECFALEE